MTCPPVAPPPLAAPAGTPDYMSPQLLASKAGMHPMMSVGGPGGHGHHGGPPSAMQPALYDGTKADVWAAGVMLVVMLIGRFPFEGTEMNHFTNLDEISAHVRGGGSRGGEGEECAGVFSGLRWYCIMHYHCTAPQCTQCMHSAPLHALVWCRMTPEHLPTTVGAHRCGRSSRAGGGMSMNRLPRTATC